MAVDVAAFLKTFHENLRICRERRGRQLEEAESKRAGEEVLPPPPTMSGEWRKRARDVFIRMRNVIGAEHAPWHHEEMWAWAGSTPEGQEWFRREVEFWEGRVHYHERQRHLTAIRICEEGFSLSDGTTLRTLLLRSRAGGPGYVMEVLSTSKFRVPVYSDDPQRDQDIATWFRRREIEDLRKHVVMERAWKTRGYRRRAGNDNDDEG